MARQQPNSQPELAEVSSQQLGETGEVGDDIDIPNLPVQLAVIEVLEYLLFLYHADGGVGKIKKIPENFLQVRIRTVGMDISDQVWFQIKVISRTSKVLNFQAREFFTSQATCLTTVAREMENKYEAAHLWTDTTDMSCPDQVSSSMWKVTTMTASTAVVQNSSPTAKLVFRIFPAPPMTNYYTKCYVARNLMDWVRADFLCRVSPGYHDICDLPPQARYKTVAFGHVIQDKTHMMRESQGVQNYLHKLKLTHPTYDVEFFLNVGGAKFFVTYRSHEPWSFLRGHRHLTSSMHHYLSRAEGSMKLQVKSSHQFMLPGVQLEGQRESLKLTAAVALLPPAPPDGVVVNTDCHHLQVLVYGPGNIPLIVPGVHPGSLQSFLRLGDYGLRLGQELTLVPDDPGPAQMDWRYRLEAADDQLTGEESLSSYTIQLIIFLDRAKQPEGPSAALHNICAVDALRQSLTSILLKHRGKIRKAISSVLSKVLHNSSSQQQRQNLLETLVPNISSSISAIVTRSTSDAFRARCFSIMQASESRELSEVVEQRLWSVAVEKYGVVAPDPEDKCDVRTNDSPQREGECLSEPKVKESKKTRPRRQNRNPSLTQRQPPFGLEEPGTSKEDGSSQDQGHLPPKDFISAQIAAEITRSVPDISGELLLPDLSDPRNMDHSESFDLLGLDLGGVEEFAGLPLDASDLVNTMDTALSELSQSAWPSVQRPTDHTAAGTTMEVASTQMLDADLDEDWFNDILYGSS